MAAVLFNNNNYKDLKYTVSVFLDDSSSALESKGAPCTDSQFENSICGVLGSSGPKSQVTKLWETLL